MLVYLITCNVSGKHYVGITTSTLPRRWSQHKSNAKHGRRGKLYSAIRKYGLQNFAIEQIATANTRDELTAKEQFFIKQYDSFVNGYNLTCGGDGSSGWVPGESFRKRRSELTAGSKNPFFNQRHTDSARARMSLLMKERYKRNPGLWFGRRFSDESKRKMSLSKLGKMTGRGNSRYKTAKRYTLGELSMTLHEWANHIHMSYYTLWFRVKSGMEFSEAISKPLGPTSRKHKERQLASSGFDCGAGQLKNAAGEGFSCGVCV